MNTATETDLSARKVTAMVEWADVLRRSAYDSLARMDITVSKAEAKIAQVREEIARRDRDHGFHDDSTNDRV